MKKYGVRGTFIWNQEDRKTKNNMVNNIIIWTRMNVTKLLLATDNRIEWIVMVQLTLGVRMAKIKQRQCDM